MHLFFVLFPVLLCYYIYIFTQYLCLMVIIDLHNWLPHMCIHLFITYQLVTMYVHTLSSSNLKLINVVNIYLLSCFVLYYLVCHLFLKWYLNDINYWSASVFNKLHRYSTIQTRKIILLRKMYVSLNILKSICN